MKWISTIITFCIIMVSLNTASALGENISDLKKLISASEDTRMNSEDLAFVLATHGFDATPKSSYVEIRLHNEIYKLTPNGNKPGLCDMAKL
jgi:hypothetical protein